VRLVGYLIRNQLVLFRDCVVTFYTTTVNRTFPHIYPIFTTNCHFLLPGRPLHSKTSPRS